MKYAVALLAVKVPIKWGILAGIIYCILCVILGKIWFHYRIVDTENEVNNIYNPFVGEMRKLHGIPINRKV